VVRRRRRSLRFVLAARYRASYHLRWIVEDGEIVGLRFTELGRGPRFDGRYRD
jgi:hypothetical protein